MTYSPREVHVWSRRQVDDMDGSDPEAVLVSITTPIIGERYENRDRFRRVLHLQFHDAGAAPEDEGRYKLFDWDMAVEVLEFAAQNLHCAWHVHCDAGMSRSVAIGRFLADHHGRALKLHACATDTFANPHVLRTLRSAAGGGYR